MKKISMDEIERAMGDINKGSKYAVVCETKNGIMICGSGVTEEEAEEDAARVAKEGCVELDGSEYVVEIERSEEKNP